MEEQINLVVCSFLGGAGLLAIIARHVFREVITYVLRTYFPRTSDYEEKSDKINLTKNEGTQDATRNRKHSAGTTSANELGERCD